MWKTRQNQRGTEKGLQSGRHERRSRDAEQRGCRNRAARTSHENLGVSSFWRSAGSDASTTNRTLVQRNSSLTSVFRRQFSTSSDGKEQQRAKAATLTLLARQHCCTHCGSVERWRSFEAAPAFDAPLATEVSRGAKCHRPYKLHFLRGAV